LIITCPCALGLAVPIVQVVAARRLFERSILTKDGEGLERIATVDTVLLDKTGTVTIGLPRLVNSDEIEPRTLALAAGLAANSRHPLSMALAESADSSGNFAWTVIQETAGMGVEGRLG